MSKFIPFPKIGQFKTAISNYKRHKSYIGTTPDGEPMYNYEKETEPQKYIGTVKMHGTNSAIIFDLSTKKFHCQSRNKIITAQSDNAGFATYIESIPKEVLMFMFEVLLLPLCNYESETFKSIGVYGEWVGPGVQHSVGLSDISEKIFVVFGVYFGDSENGKFIPIKNIPSFKDDSNYLNSYKIYFIGDLAPIYEVEIDFNLPQLSQNFFVEKTVEIETECPVAKYFGVKGVGEGLVWTPEDSELMSNPDLWFKTKGEKHSSSKVTTIASVDLEKINSVLEFVNYALTERRLEQGLEYLKEMGLEITRKNTPVFLNWIIKDVTTEEKLEIEKNNIDLKDLNKHLSLKARDFYFKSC